MQRSLFTSARASENPLSRDLHEKWSLATLLQTHAHTHIFKTNTQAVCTHSQTVRQHHLQTDTLEPQWESFSSRLCLDVLWGLQKEREDVPDCETDHPTLHDLSEGKEINDHKFVSVQGVIGQKISVKCQIWLNLCLCLNYWPKYISITSSMYSLISIYFDIWCAMHGMVICILMEQLRTSEKIRSQRPLNP